MRLSTKSAGAIEQKGVAQLLQVEEVRLKSSRRCGFNQSPRAQEASNFSSLLHSLRHTLLGFIVACKLFSILKKLQDTASLIGRGAPRGK